MLKHMWTRRSDRTSSEGENATVTLYITQNEDWSRSSTSQDSRTLSTCYSPLELPVCASEGALRDDVLAFTFDMTNMAFLCRRSTEILLEICPQNAGIDLCSICDGWGLDELGDESHIQHHKLRHSLQVAKCELVQSPTVADST